MIKNQILLMMAAIPFLLSCEKPVTFQINHELSPEGQVQIIGGQNAAAHEFPFLINIWMDTPEDHYVGHHCGGSLIHARWVLTAAHCILEDETETTQRPVKAKSIKLFIAGLRADGSDARLLQARKIIPHPAFSWPHNDIALIELSEAVTDIAPIALSAMDFGNSNTPLNATVIGWGLTDRSGLIEGAILQKITLPLISRDECRNDEYVQKKGWPIGLDTLCAQTHYNEKASCPGDSGGPLFIEKNGNFEQIGVVSWGSACSGNNLKTNSNVEGHTNVSHALTWIHSLISKH